MPVVTLEGYLGSGYQNIGRKVSENLDIDFVDRVILKNDRGYGIGYFFTVIFAQVVLGILASTIVCWYSRRREFRADYGGAQLTSKESMISSLRALERFSAAKLPDQMLAFGISNKGQISTLQKLYSSHS